MRSRYPLTPAQRVRLRYLILGLLQVVGGDARRYPEPRCTAEIATVLLGTPVSEGSVSVLTGWLVREGLVRRLRGATYGLTEEGRMCLALLRFEPPAGLPENEEVEEYSGSA